MIDSTYSSPNVVTFRNVISDNSATLSTRTLTESKLLSTNFRWAAIACTDKFTEAACSMLYNLCVLQHYDTAVPACAAYNAIPSDQSPPSTFDQLFYSGTSMLTDSSSFDRSAQIVGDSGTLDFVLTAYNVDGTVARTAPLSTELQLCSGAGTVGDPVWTQLARYHEEYCELPSANIVGLAAPMVYKLSVRDDAGTLHDVPVLDTRQTVSGKLVNDGSAMSSWTLSKRFTMYDNVLGVEASGGSTDPVAVSVSSAVQLVMRPAPLSQSMYIPYVVVSAIDVLQTDVGSTGPVQLTSEPLPFSELLSSTATPAVSFKVTYQSSDIAFWAIVGCWLAVVFLVGLAWTVVPAFILIRLSGAQIINVHLILRLVATLCGSVADALFAGTMVVTVFVLLIYRLQVVVLILPPVYSFPIHIIIGIIAFLKIVHVALTYFHLATVDLFIMDWEGAGKSASAWRRVQATNQFIRVASRAPFGVPLNSVIVLLLLYGLKLAQASDLQPKLYNSYSSFGLPENGIMRVAVTGTTVFVVAVVQVVVTHYILHRFIVNDPIRTFIDLLGASNLSCVILTDTSSGYYIHGRSVHSSTDQPMGELCGQLERESSGMTEPRGLSSKETEGVATYRLFLTEEVFGSVAEAYGAAKQDAAAPRAPPPTEPKAGDEDEDATDDEESSDASDGMTSEESDVDGDEAPSAPLAPVVAINPLATLWQIFTGSGPLPSAGVLDRWTTVNALFTKLIDKAKVGAGSGRGAEIRPSSPLLRYLNIGPNMTDRAANPRPVVTPDWGFSLNRAVPAGNWLMVAVLHAVAFSFIDALLGPYVAAIVTVVGWGALQYVYTLLLRFSVTRKSFIAPQFIL